MPAGSGENQVEATRTQLAIALPKQPDSAVVQFFDLTQIKDDNPFGPVDGNSLSCCPISNCSQVVRLPSKLTTRTSSRFDCVIFNSLPSSQVRNSDSRQYRFPNFGGRESSCMMSECGMPNLVSNLAVALHPRRLWSEHLVESAFDLAVKQFSPPGRFAADRSLEARKRCQHEK